MSERDDGGPATPKGVVVLFVGPDGYVWGRGVDFERQAAGGCSLQDSQSYRARNRLALDVMSRVLSPVFAKHLATYAFENVMERLRDQDGFKVHEIAIGHDND